MLQGGPFNHSGTRYAGYIRARQRVDSKAALRAVTVPIIGLEGEVDVAITNRALHLCILEEFPLARCRRELHLEDQAAITGLANHAVGTFRGNGNCQTCSRFQTRFNGAGNQLQTPFTISSPLRSHCPRAIGNRLRSRGAKELDRLDGKVAVVLDVERIAVIGCFDHHGVKTTLLNLEVLVVLSPCRIRPKGKC